MDLRNFGLTTVELTMCKHIIEYDAIQEANLGRHLIVLFDSLAAIRRVRELPIYENVGWPNCTDNIL